MIINEAHHNWCIFTALASCRFIYSSFFLPFSHLFTLVKTCITFNCFRISRLFNLAAFHIHYPSLSYRYHIQFFFSYSPIIIFFLSIKTTLSYGRSKLIFFFSPHERYNTNNNTVASRYNFSPLPL